MAADALVAAVAAAGRRVGRVGDRGRTLVSGELFVASFLTPLVFGTLLDTLGLLSRVGLITADASEARGGLLCDGDFWVLVALFLVASLIALVPLATALGSGFCTFGEAGVF